MRVSDFARALGVHKSTASRLAATLEAAGFLSRADDRGAFRLGVQIVRLGVLALQGHGWVEVARPVLEQLAEDTGETAFISVPAGEEAIDVAQVAARRLVAAGSWVGRRTPLHATSDGKLFLALGAGRLPSDAPLKRIACCTITDRARLEDELERVRSAGYSCARSEAEDGLNGVAVPILDTAGRCIAALSVSGPDYRVQVERLPRIAVLCHTAAGEIRERLGWGTLGEEAA